LFQILKNVAVPVASAEASVHVPLFEEDPPEAAAMKSVGRVMLARTLLPLNALVALAGTVPS
jgi:hypothetical protein